MTDNLGNADTTKKDFQDALAKVCSSYVLHIHSYKTLPSEGADLRADGMLAVQIFLFKTDEDECFLRARILPSKINSTYKWQYSWFGCLPGVRHAVAPGREEPLWEHAIPGGIMGGSPRTYVFRTEALKNGRYHPNDEVFVVDYEPKTFSKTVGSITTESSKNFSLTGGAEGKTPLLGITGGEESSKSKSIDVQNYDVFCFGTPVHWEHKIDHGDAELYPPMEGEFILQNISDPDDLDYSTHVTLFFGAHFFKKSDHHAFCVGTAPIKIDWKNLEISLVSSEEGDEDHDPADKECDNTLNRERGLPFESDMFHGELMDLYKHLK